MSHDYYYVIYYSGDNRNITDEAPHWCIKMLNEDHYYDDSECDVFTNGTYDEAKEKSLQLKRDTGRDVYLEL